MIFFPVFILFIAFQRGFELIIARRNAGALKERGAVEIDKGGYNVIVLMHILFFISLITEKLALRPQVNVFFYPFIGLFLAAQALRYWSITSLGKFWNTRIIVLKGAALIKKGPYRFLSHPNYIAVITEIAAIPLIFSCYITAVAFSVLNIALLIRRIKIEKNALASFEYS